MYRLLPETPLTSSSDVHLVSVGLSPALSSSLPLSTVSSALQGKARDARLQVAAQYSGNSLDMNMLANNNAMMDSMNGPSSATQSIALNTIAQGSGATLFRTNMNVSNSGSNPFQNLLPQLQQEQLVNNFVGNPGMNRSPDQSRVSLGQVSPCCLERCLPWFCFYYTEVKLQTAVNGCKIKSKRAYNHKQK